MIMSPDRIDWNRLREHYPEWRRKGYWIEGSPWFGFDVTHSKVIGTETFLLWMADDPQGKRRLYFPGGSFDSGQCQPDGLPAHGCTGENLGEVFVTVSR